MFWVMALVVAVFQVVPSHGLQWQCVAGSGAVFTQFRDSLAQVGGLTPCIERAGCDEGLSCCNRLQLGLR
jgi:hypothetical protein